MSFPGECTGLGKCHAAEYADRIRALEALVEHFKELDASNTRRYETAEVQLAESHRAHRECEAELRLERDTGSHAELCPYRADLAAAREADRRHALWAHNVQQGFGVESCPVCQPPCGRDSGETPGPGVPGQADVGTGRAAANPPGRVEQLRDFGSRGRFSRSRRRSAETQECGV